MNYDPEKKRYMSTRDVQEVLGVSRTTANQIMHIFESRGELFRHQNTMRVPTRHFEKWVRENTI